MSVVSIGSPTRAATYCVFWRLHFWAGLLAAPIVVFAALTGLIYAVSPQIEAWRHAGLDRVASGLPLPLDEQVAAAQRVLPHHALRSVVPAHMPGDTTQVFFNAPHAQHAATGEHGHGLPDGAIVYVDPSQARVAGHLNEMQRFKTWSKKLHSSALQGDGWRWIIELGASWMLVMFATGLTLWWPRSQAQGGPGWRALMPRWGRGRQTWRDLHAIFALALGLVLAIVLVTGLTWAKYTGENFRVMQELLRQEPPRPSKQLRSMMVNSARPLSWQAIYDLSLPRTPDISLQLTPPDAPDGVWRVENFDRSQPTSRFLQVVDAYSGQLLFASDWSQLPALSKATAVGIPFHRGEFGLWNQALLGLAALAAVFSVVSGVVMWWKRRPTGQWAVPALSWQRVCQLPGWIWGLGGILAWAMPVFGWSLLALMAVESMNLLKQKLLQTRPC